MENKYYYLESGAAKYSNAVDANARFIMEKQLKDKELWEKFVKVFRDGNADDADNGWRGEFFGKMMRGACLTYRYLPDGELYSILYDTVKALLDTQDGCGRITTYSKDAEFNGWDMWTRKYVLVGCLYFYGICKDGDFKSKILESMEKQVDYLIGHIGEGKLSILDTSQWWGGLNSSSILEPIVELYRLTHKDRYLDFAEYILNAGGCKGGNLLELAEAGELMPYQYPEVKAYEMMSYFEGALAYYEVTGKERYLNIVKRFSDAVLQSDITIIGCAGCTHELFDNSALRQTEETIDKAIMQETCVTVTWMRLQERLFKLTGDVKYVEAIERSALNALYGSLNIHGNPQYCSVTEKYLDGVPFDSYSPLTYKARGIGIGGYKEFKDGGYYGCCACIGAAGTALYPLISVLAENNGYVFNIYNQGVIEAKTPNGEKAVFTVTGDYLSEGRVSVTLGLTAPEEITLHLRIPEWSRKSRVSVNGICETVQAGYLELTRKWQDGDIIELCFTPKLEETVLNQKAAYIYGALVLARDEQKKPSDITLPFLPVTSGGTLEYKRIDPECGEQVRILLNTDGGDVLLTDYASCGKKWTEKNARISVWLNRK